MPLPMLRVLPSRAMAAVEAMLTRQTTKALASREREIMELRMVSFLLVWLSDAPKKQIAQEHVFLLLKPCQETYVQIYCLKSCT
jgi:hypothetical protein